MQSRLGEVMTEQPKAKGGEHGGKAGIDRFRENPIPAITLAQAGIDKFNGVEGKMTIRTMLLWITGTAASAIVGALIVEWLRLRGINFTIGAVAGGCAFACLRLWVEERASPSKGSSRG